MRILIGGDGTPGTQAAAALTAGGNDVTVIDADDRRLARVAPRRRPGGADRPGRGQPGRGPARQALLETTLTAASRATGLPPGAAGQLQAGDQLLLLSRSTDGTGVEALFQGGGRPGPVGPVGPGRPEPTGAS